MTTAANRFENFVNARVREANSPQNQRETLRQEWTAAVESFLATVRGYLGDYVREKKMHLVAGRQFMHESMLGSYEINNLTIELGHSKILLSPKGFEMVGVRGRIDMVGPQGIQRFVRVERRTVFPGSPRSSQPPLLEAGGGKDSATGDQWVWKLSTSLPSIRYRGLTKDAFYDALISVIDG